MKISKYSALYSASVLAMSGLALQVLGFLYRILISRMTDAEGMGVYQLIFPFYSVITAGSLLSGLTVAVTQIAAERHVFGDWKGIGQLVRRCLTLFFCLFAVIAAVTVLFADFWAGEVLGDIRTKKAILLLLPCLLFTGVENTIKACFFGVKQVRPPITSELLEQTVRITAVAVFLFTFRPTDPGMVAALIVCGMIVSEICSAVCLTLFYRKHIRGRHFSSQTDAVSPERALSSRELLKSICMIALPVAASAILNNFLSSADTVLIPKRLAVSGLGQEGALSAFGAMFGMTLPLVSLPTMFMGPLCNVMTPRLAENMALGNIADV
ncbi:MAG: oligosaccharide flippase family protein, partial [Clostridiales bacterium]|nr:oligosaccharide flippase family protein [Clostridiales bacterium]